MGGVISLLWARSGMLNYVTECLESVYPPQEDFPPTDDDTNEYEFEFDGEEMHVTRRHGVVIDIEEGRLNSDGQGELGTKCYIFYFLTMTCGLLASLFTFSFGMTAVLQCRGNPLLPALFMYMGATGIFPLLWIVYKLLRKKFDGFRSYEKSLFELSCILFLMLWFIAIFALFLTDTKPSAIMYCKPEFYRYTVIANLLPIFAVVVSLVLQHRQRNKKAT